MKIALITGASSGIGRAYVQQADMHGYDEIWVVARRADRLEELARRCITPVRTIALDLGCRVSCDALRELLDQSARADADFHVGLLVNAAGFAKFATGQDLAVEETDAMIDLNCRALVAITRIVMPYMTKGSRILQIASSAAFQPLPGLNVYAASKAFVLSYTRALRFELIGEGIYVTAVCPIWVKTEFNAVARNTAGACSVKHTYPQISPQRVAKWSLRVNAVNYPVATCAISSFLMRIAGKLLPAWFIMDIWEGLRRI